MAKKTIHKPSLDHNMIVTKVRMTWGPSIRETDKSRGDTETERQINMDAAPSNRNLSNCEKTRVYNRNRYVAWIFDKRMNPLYDSDLEMIPSTDKKNYKTQPAKLKNLPPKDQRESGGSLSVIKIVFQ